MRIALVTPHATPDGCYATTDRGPHVIPLARALGQAGHDVTVYARADSRSLPAQVKAAPSVTVVHVPAGPRTRIATDDLGPYVAAFGEALASCWRREVPDIVHAYSWAGGLAALAGARDMDVPVVATFHSLTSHPTSAGANGTRRARRVPDSLDAERLSLCVAKSADMVLARSDAEFRTLVSLGVPRSAIHVVPWGTDTALFTPDGPASPAAPATRERRAPGRRATAPEEAKPRLLAAWPMAPHHGLDIVIRALADLPGAQLSVIGGPPRGRVAQSRVYQGAMSLAAKLDVADRLSFTGGVSSEDLPALLRSADLLVSGAWDGLFDEMALQAMACGTPVAAPATGFYADAIIDGTTGILVPPGRPGVLGRRIRKTLASPMRLEAFGIAAADRARARYSWDRIGPETSRAYQRLLPVTEPVETAAPELAELAEPELAGAVAGS